ncbi:MAG: hypothetical protein C5S38_02460 [Candidatus Methanophagaceae archaeon]|nr:MAG: hypothetical protein C5S38_02460 [Methanophagales archaeon]
MSENSFTSLSAEICLLSKVFCNAPNRFATFNNSHLNRNEFFSVFLIINRTNSGLIEHSVIFNASFVIFLPDFSFIRYGSISMEMSAPIRAPSNAISTRPSVSFTRCPKHAFNTTSVPSFDISTTISVAVGTTHPSAICLVISSISGLKELAVIPYSCCSSSANFDVLFETIKAAILARKSPTSCAMAKGTGISSPSQLGISPTFFTPGSTFICSPSSSTSGSTIRHVSPFATNNAPVVAKFNTNRSSSMQISLPVTISNTLYFRSSGIIERLP